MPSTSFLEGEVRRRTGENTSPESNIKCDPQVERATYAKGRTSKEMLLVETTREKEVYRERLHTTVVALDLDLGEITDIAA